MKGYDVNFIADSSTPVPFPVIAESAMEKIARLATAVDEYVLNYENYSVVQDKERRFPLFTACNISGKQFIKIDRKEVGDNWKKDERIAADAQWGQELYDAPKSDFDRGHMTKREDVQWGGSKEEAMNAARSTYFFTNAAPQHARLNRGIWKSLEHYILKTEAVKNQDRICLFTGPVLADDDPLFVSQVNDQKIKIPVLFWKVVYYKSEKGQLSRVAFITNQREILSKKGIVERQPITRGPKDSGRFSHFKNAEIYQCNIHVIEEVTGLKFAPAAEPYQDDRAVRLVVNEVNVRSATQTDWMGANEFPMISVKNLTL